MNARAARGAIAARGAFALTVIVGVALMVGSTGFAPVLLLPAAITAIPLLANGDSNRRAVRIAAAALLLGWVLFSIASVGMLYLPSTLLLVIAAAR